MEYENVVLTFLESGLVLFLGLCAGSFSSALVYRIPHHLNWVSERSRCPNCYHVLGALDLIPVFSWLLSHCKCRYCKSSISPIYPLLELISGLLALGVYFRFGLTYESGIILLALPFLMSLFIIDLKSYTLPNQFNFILFFLGLIRLFLASLYGVDGHLYFIAAVIYGGLAWLLGVVMKNALQKEALGFGDVKFFMVAGLWLGLDLLPYFLMFSGVFGILFGIIWQKITQSKLFPFGPSLIVSFYILLLYQGSIIM